VVRVVPVVLLLRVVRVRPARLQPGPVWSQQPAGVVPQPGLVSQ
jgi:hypothetical protein